MPGRSGADHEEVVGKPALGQARLRASPNARVARGIIGREGRLAQKRLRLAFSLQPGVAANLESSRTNERLVFDPNRQVADDRTDLRHAASVGGDHYRRGRADGRELGLLANLLSAEAKARLNAFLDALAKQQRAQREIGDELIELGLSLEAIVANFPFTDQAIEALADGQTDLNAIFPYPLATAGHAAR